MDFVAPPRLRPGDAITVVAPSSGFRPADLWPGLGRLRERYRVVASSGILAREGFLAGSDERREGELRRALLDPSIRAIFAARGGYGSTRFGPRLPWDRLAESPKWIVGFSDVTALHLEASRVGVASIHGPNVTGLGRASPLELAGLVGLLERHVGPVWEGLRVVHGEGASEVLGTAVGGNLSLLESMAASGRLALPGGCVLLLEDVTERPYRLDRMLTALREGGHLARAAAIVIGGLDACAPGPDLVTADQVLAERTRDLGVPVLAGAPFGHGASNRPWPCGFVARLQGSKITFEAPK